MGLRQGDSSHPETHIFSAWLVPIVAISIAVVVAIFGDTGRTWLSFDRTAIHAGEFWRLLTGHIVHLGPTHLLWDSAGLLLVWYLIGDSFGHRQWLLVTLAAIIGIDLGFWFLEPQLFWYVGLSGVVHGLLAAGIVAQLRTGRVDIWILCIAVIGKLVYEQVIGPLPGSEESSGGTVIVAAHVYGALAGAVAAGLIMIRVRRRSSI